MSVLTDIGARSKSAQKLLAKAGSAAIDKALNAVEDALEREAEFIIAENKKDIESGEANGLSKALIDRLAVVKIGKGDLRAPRLPALVAHDGFRRAVGIGQLQLTDRAKIFRIESAVSAIPDPSDRPARTDGHRKAVLSFLELARYVKGLVLHAIGIARPTGREHLTAELLAVETRLIDTETAYAKRRRQRCALTHKAFPKVHCRLARINGGLDPLLNFHKNLLYKQKFIFLLDYTMKLRKNQ